MKLFRRLLPLRVTEAGNGGVVLEQSTKSAIEDLISSLGLQVGAPFVATRDESVKRFVECSSTTPWSPQRA